MASSSPEARFAAIIDLLSRSVAARIAGGGLAAPLIVLIWTRLQRLGERFASLTARLAAGRLAAPRRRAAAPRPVRPASPSRLPRGRAWLVLLVPDAACMASQLQHLLAEPEMAALIAAAPQAGRIVRPLCRMLGIRPPAILALPPRPAKRPAPPRRTAVVPAFPAASPPGPAPGTPPAPLRPPCACGPPLVSA